MSKSIYKKIGIASLIMMASVFLSRVIGLFREMVIAYIGGAGAAVDAYQVAFVIPGNFKSHRRQRIYVGHLYPHFFPLSDPGPGR